MTSYKGYMGKIMQIDLSTKEVSEYPWTDKDRKKYVGGKAVASKIMFDNFKGDEDPLGEKNMIIISTGPVTGTGAPSSNRFDISALSPQTGITTSSNCGGDFGYYLKKAGYDAIIIKGKLDAPGWIEINNDKFEFHDASGLWGLNVGPTQEKLKEILDKKYNRNFLCGMVTIGPAGENMVKYSAVISGERAAGRAGTGAVFGSKNLKAVVASGSHKIEVYNRKKLDIHHEKWIKHLSDHPLTGGQLPKLGSAGLVSSMQVNGQLGTKNFSRGTYEEFEKVNGEALDDIENIVNGGCVSCPIRCSRRVKVDGENVKGPELETLGLLGPNILNNNVSLVCRWNKEIDELGMDTISCAQTIAWAMEANERGIWDSGLEFGKTDNLSQIFDDIAHRRGVGNELAEGSKRLSEKYGGKDFAMQVKGLEISAYHPANAVGQGLGYAVANRGGCHLNGGYLVVLEGLGLHVDPHTTRGKADLCMMMQDLMESISMQGQCLFTSYAVFPGFLINKPNSALTKIIEWIIVRIGWAVRLINKLPEIACFHLGMMIPYTKELQLATGMKMTLGKMIRNGERSYNVERAVNAKFGVCADNDKLPKELKMVPVEKMKKTYYAARGWGKDGLPNAKKLRRLGII